MATSIVSLSEFKAKAAQMLDDIKASQDHLIITQNGSATAVVQDYEAYQNLQQSLAMLRLMVEGEADIRDKRTTSQQRVFTDLRKRLKSQDG